MQINLKDDINQCLMVEKSHRGGARPNTGPKPLEPKVRRSIGLSQRQWTIFDKLGGNEWLRQEIDAKQSDNI